MSRKKSNKRHKFYKMKGCSKKTRKNCLGGSADVNLAYTGNKISTIPNPFLAYTGKGGSSLGNSSIIPINTNAANKTVPNTGPVSLGGLGTYFLNPQGSQIGGTCGSCGLMKGGNKHRVGCKCSTCKMKGGNQGIPYPNGLTGSPWTPAIEGWPGVNSVQGSSNYIAPNNYDTDIQTAMISTGSQPPFSVGGRKRRTRKQRGGALSNFIAQDLINLGRQFQFGLGSAYNAISGYNAPVNPMPWNGQLPNTPSLSTIRSSSI